ncbi:MAG: lipopolysaccharide biosynthesis protein [Deltaproteobacteria bacterium]|nr:lipopolysaccharide biosynthesis protein [Deltaproteobacteria bacterium]
MKPETSLSQRVTRGGMWVFVLRGVEKVLGLVRLVILARLLAPSDFGLFGIALLAMSTLETFSQTGFQTALIQRKEDITHYLDTAWTVSIIRGVILFIIIFLSAPHVSLFFNTPEASIIIQIIGISLILGGFSNIGTLYFQKELEFNKQFVYRLTSSLVEFITVVSAALIFKNVWAFVFGMLAGSLTGLIASYVIHPYRPHFRLDLGKIRELFVFGRWVFWSTILIFLITQGDDVFVGKVLGATMLGFYQMAYRISNMPTTEITQVISQVTFPAYSKMQDDLPRLREAYLRVLQLTAFLSFPIAGFIFIFASDFTRIFLGDKWMLMVSAMQLLACAGLVRSIAASSGFIFYAVGKPKIDTTMQIIRFFVLIALIYPLTMKLEILGTSIAVFVSIFVSCIGFIIMTIRITKCSTKKFSQILIFPFINVAVVLVLVSIFKISIKTGIWEFIALACLCFLSYFIITYLLDKFFNYGMQSLIKESVQSFRTS